MLKLFSCAVPFCTVFRGPQRLFWYALDNTAVFCVASRYCIILCSGWAMRRRCINKVVFLSRLLNKVVHKCCKCYFPITQNVVLCSFEVGGLGAMRRRCMQRGPNLNQTSCRGASVRSSQGEKNKETDTSDLQHMINIKIRLRSGWMGNRTTTIIKVAQFLIFF